MVKYFYLWICLMLLSCHDDETSKSPTGVNATIIGIDLTLTPCSGGMIIKLDDLSHTYQWNNNNNQFGITDSTILPLKVNIEFDIDPATCSILDGFITISALEKK